jgi:hypothetical protein
MDNLQAQRISGRNDTDRAAGEINYRHMAKISFEHDVQRVPEGFVRRNRYRVGGHDLADRRLLRRTPGGDDLERKIALGADAGESTVSGLPTTSAPCLRRCIFSAASRTLVSVGTAMKSRFLMTCMIGRFGMLISCTRQVVLLKLG